MLIDKSIATQRHLGLAIRSLRRSPGLTLIAIGSGGPYAKSAALALLDNTDLDARTITEKALEIAAATCIYTNNQFSIEILE